MEMNVSTQEEQLVAKKSGGLNPAIVLPILLAIGVLIYLFEYFPSISFIGLGAIRGERGDLWKPRLVIHRND